MKCDELKTRAQSLAQDGKRVCVFGKSCIYTENYGSSAYFTFFDHDVPIFGIYTHSSNSNEYVHSYKLQDWKYSITTTRHTKIALDIIALTIYVRYGIDVDPDVMFTEIDNGINNIMYERENHEKQQSKENQRISGKKGNWICVL